VNFIDKLDQSRVALSEHNFDAQNVAKAAKEREEAMRVLS
jgi:hypothetical protein